jgi:hypothetical protein
VKAKAAILCADGTRAHRWHLESPDAGLPRDRDGVVLVEGQCTRCGHVRTYRASDDMDSEAFKRITLKKHPGLPRRRKP